jgi:hypothetical protein
VTQGGRRSPSTLSSPYLVASIVGGVRRRDRQKRGKNTPPLPMYIAHRRIHSHFTRHTHTSTKYAYTCARTCAKMKKRETIQEDEG